MCNKFGIAYSWPKWSWKHFNQSSSRFVCYCGNNGTNLKLVPVRMTDETSFETLEDRLYLNRLYAKHVAFDYRIGRKPVFRA